MNDQKTSFKPYIGLIGFSLLLIFSGVDIFMRAVGASIALYGMYEMTCTKAGKMAVPKVRYIQKILIGLAIFFVPDLITVLIG